MRSDLNSSNFEIASQNMEGCKGLIRNLKIMYIVAITAIPNSESHITVYFLSFKGSLSYNNLWNEKHTPRNYIYYKSMKHIPYR